MNSTRVRYFISRAYADGYKVGDLVVRKAGEPGFEAERITRATAEAIWGPKAVEGARLRAVNGVGFHLEFGHPGEKTARFFIIPENGKAYNSNYILKAVNFKQGRIREYDGSGNCVVLRETPLTSVVGARDMRHVRTVEKYAVNGGMSAIDIRDSIFRVMDAIRAKLEE